MKKFKDKTKRKWTSKNMKMTRKQIKCNTPRNNRRNAKT